VSSDYYGTIAGETADAKGRHFPSGSFTDLTYGNGGMARHQCGGCEAPIVSSYDRWLHALTGSASCPGNPEAARAAGAALAARTCEKDGEITDTYGAEHYRRHDQPGTVTVPSGRLLREDHAGELGYGPKQEEYGFDPNDGFNMVPEREAAQAAETKESPGSGQCPR
jgi:hypothetical protein